MIKKRGSNSDFNGKGDRVEINLPIGDLLKEAGGIEYNWPC